MQAQGYLLIRFLVTLRSATARLAFWRKAPVTPDGTADVQAGERAAERLGRAAAERPAAARASKEAGATELAAAHPKPSATQSDAVSGTDKPARARSSGVEEASPEPEPIAKLSFFARFKQLWKRPPAVAPEEAETARLAIPAAAIPSPRLEVEVATAASAEEGRLARLLKRLRPRRALPEEDATAAESRDKDAALPDLTKTRALRRASLDDSGPVEDMDTEAEAGPRRFARWRTAFAQKKIWIPASVIMLAVLSASLTVSLRAHKKAPPAKTAKAKPAAPRPSVAAVALPAPVSVTPAPAAAPAKPVDPAFEIVGHVKAETDSGVDESDCVVKDKASVSANLKNCILRFNGAMSKAPTVAAKH